MKRLSGSIEVRSPEPGLCCGVLLRLAKALSRSPIPLCLVAVLYPALPCHADGKVFPPTAFPVNVTIPDQRALIHFTNGIERLVIETRFTGSGTNFAWVVPLPSQPVIEEASTGLFPTLQYLFRPQIKHNVPRYYLGILVAVGFVCLLRLVASSGWSALLIALLILLLAALLIPTLSTAGSKGMASSDTGQAVSILDRRLVGVFETTTIASRDLSALQTWLRENGFAISTNSRPVIASYVKDGWVFVAAKVRRDKPDAETSTPHPLSFTFKSGTPVYPMRLTGVDNGPLTVELYVFGPKRAEAENFKVERCTHPSYPAPPEPSPYAENWLRRAPEPPAIVHLLLRKWVAGAPVATKLTATLTPAQMQQDVWLRWSDFLEKKGQLYSEAGALTVGLNWGSALFAIGLIAAYALLFVRPTRQPHFGPAVGLLTVASLVLTGLIYISLPTTKVRLVKRPSLNAYSTMFRLRDQLPEQPATRAELSTAARGVLSPPTNNLPPEHTAFSTGKESWDNLLLGGAIREEDSPGNFTLRENGDKLEFVVYDTQGAEHVLDSWPLRPPH